MEGPKAYWDVNNSWYMLMDSGPWNPWIPSNRNIHCSASDEHDDIGIVAIPHLSRDLMAVFDGPGSYYGTYPQNILRGMVYEDRELPYLKNIVGQYRSKVAKTTCGTILLTVQISRRDAGDTICTPHRGRWNKSG